MTCGLTVVRRVDWQKIDAEIRDIMLRVWGVEPVTVGDRLILPAGKPTAIEQLRASVQEVKRYVEQAPKALNPSRPNEPGWLEGFIREHEPHEHPALRATDVRSKQRGLLSYD